MRLASVGRITEVIHGLGFILRHGQAVCAKDAEHKFRLMIPLFRKVAQRLHHLFAGWRGNFIGFRQARFGMHIEHFLHILRASFLPRFTLSLFAGEAGFFLTSQTLRFLPRFTFSLFTGEAGFFLTSQTLRLLLSYALSFCKGIFRL